MSDDVLFGLQCPSSGEKQAAVKPSGETIGARRTASATSIIRVGQGGRHQGSK
ncbi:hypothetical protein [Kribbella alba]